MQRLLRNKFDVFVCATPSPAAAWPGPAHRPRWTPPLSPCTAGGGCRERGTAVSAEQWQDLLELARSPSPSHQPGNPCQTHSTAAPKPRQLPAAWCKFATYVNHSEQCTAQRLACRPASFQPPTASTPRPAHTALLAANALACAEWGAAAVCNKYMALQALQRPAVLHRKSCAAPAQPRLCPHRTNRNRQESEPRARVYAILC